MNKKAGLLINTIILAVVLAVGVFVGLRFNDSSHELVDLQEENDNLQSQIDELQNKIEELQKETAEDEKLRFCPDEWYDNQMPCSCATENCSECNNPPRQYFIVDGVRRELSEFDMVWVEENCDLEIIVAY